MNEYEWVSMSGQAGSEWVGGWVSELRKKKA